MRVKFIYLADTHFGGDDDLGYRQQARYLSRAGELIRSLGSWISARGDIDFIIHGGDLADTGTVENIRLAAELMAQLPCPVYLALGNHDLTESDSHENWLKYAPRLFPENQTDFTLSHGLLDIDIVCVHWSRVPYVWIVDEPQVPYFDRDQLAALNTSRPGRSRIVVTHAPPCGIPTGQTGFDQEYHTPEGDFSQLAKMFTGQHKPLLFLGAHTHMNMHCEYGPAHFVTASSFTEVPFEFKLIETDGQMLRMETVSLADRMPFATGYDFNKTYVQGRPCDREFGNG